MPSDIPLSGEILTPDQVAKRQLKRAPVWLQKLTSNALAALAWIGLPSTVLSTLSNLKFVIDGAVYLYERAGVIQPVLVWIGQAISFVVQVWRSLTHPIWNALSELLHWTLPAWAPDVLTLVALCVLGALRRAIRSFLGDSLSQASMLYAVRREPSWKSQLTPIPRSFPYTDYFAGFGIHLAGRRLADAKRLWRKWRRRQIENILSSDRSVWPVFPEETVRAQFGRYWQAVQDGRRDLAIYAGSASLLLCAFLIDWLVRHAQ